METLIRFGLVVLATYRVAHLVASERGPLDVFHKLRSAIYKRWPDTKATVEAVTSYQESWQFDGITCIDCLSFWLAWVSVLALPFESYPMYVVNALAVSAVCVLINHNSK